MRVSVQAHTTISARLKRKQEDQKVTYPLLHSEYLSLFGLYDTMSQKQTKQIAPKVLYHIKSIISYTIPSYRERMLCDSCVHILLRNG